MILSTCPFLPPPSGLALEAKVETCGPPGSSPPIYTRGFTCTKKETEESRREKRGMGRQSLGRRCKRGKPEQRCPRRNQHWEQKVKQQEEDSDFSFTRVICDVRDSPPKPHAPRIPSQSSSAVANSSASQPEPPSPNRPCSQIALVSEVDAPPVDPQPKEPPFAPPLKRALDS